MHLITEELQHIFEFLWDFKVLNYLNCKRFYFDDDSLSIKERMSACTCGYTCSKRIS
jgi:hypothetical protein